MQRKTTHWKVNLKTIINKTAVKNKDIILSNNISLNVHDIDTYVNTDAKWLEFIVNQIISNSIKYKRHQERLISKYIQSKDRTVAQTKWGMLCFI